MKKKDVLCDSCQSEFSISYKESLVVGPLLKCPFCGESIDEDDQIEDMSDDDEEDVITAWEEDE